MSMVVTRSPLTAIGMNGVGAAAPKRRSARLSAEGQEDDERPSKKTKTDGAQSVGTVKDTGVAKRTRGKGRIRGILEVARLGRNEMILRSGLKGEC